MTTAIKELETYKTMRGPKAPPGVQDDIDDLIQRAEGEAGGAEAAARRASAGAGSLRPRAR